MSDSNDNFNLIPSDNQLLSILDAALDLHRGGCKVIPVNDKKAPLLSKGYKDLLPTQDEDLIRTWFSPSTWGLAVYLYPLSPFMVLDFDGPHAIEAWDKKAKTDSPETACNQTRSGYWHFIYKVPDGFSENFEGTKRAVRLVEADCDCKTASGAPHRCGVDFLINGYAVFPPSPGYRVIKPISDAVIIPDEILNFVRSSQLKAACTSSGSQKVARSSVPRKSSGHTVSNRVSESSVSAKKLNYEDILNGVPQGKRDETLFKYACSLRGRKVGRAEAILLVNAAAAKCIPRYGPPHDDRSAEDIVKHAYEDYKSGSGTGDINIDETIKSSGINELTSQSSPEDQRNALKKLTAAVKDCELLDCNLIREAAVAKLSGIGIKAPAKMVDAALADVERADNYKWDETLPFIDANNRKLNQITRQIIDALIEKNATNPSFFLRANQLVRLIKKGQGEFNVDELSADSLVNEAEHAANFYSLETSGNSKDFKVPAFPPQLGCKNILSERQLPFPVLDRVITTPVFDSDGRLITNPGYHSGSRIYYLQPPIFETLKISEKPSEEETKSARDLLLDVLIDFPFTSGAEIAHAVAMILQPFARDMIAGQTPLFLIEKPTPGTGAGLLAEVTSTIFTGHFKITTPPLGEEEWKKLLTSLVIEGRSIVVLDDLVTLTSKNFSAILTSPEWSDRDLGRSRMVTGLNRSTWIATGNNPDLLKDIARRTIRIRLDRQVDEPWMIDLSKFQHPDLLDYVKTQRCRLVWGCLTVIQHWISQGKQPYTKKSFGSFGDWARIMGGILQSINVEGFLENFDPSNNSSDTETKSWSQFVGVWSEKFNGTPVGTSELYTLIDSPYQSIDIYLGKDSSDRSRKTSLGKSLTRMRDRVFQGHRIVYHGEDHNRSLWKLVELDRLNNVSNNFITAMMASVPVQCAPSSFEINTPAATIRSSGPN